MSTSDPKGSRERRPQRGLDPWNGLIAIGWTLVDRFEANGRRYILACENDPGPVGLSAREGQVVASVALGRSTKEVAHALGLADSTVRVLLTRASRKLRASTRAELVQRFDALSAAGKRKP